MTPIHPSSPLCGHPLANLFPMCDDGEMDILTDSVRDGYDTSNPIILLEGMVLDGRNRLFACLEAGVEPSFRNFNPAKEGSPVLYVFRHNLPRRSLSPSDRAAIAIKFAAMLEQEGEGLPVHKGERTREAMARVSGASERLIQDGLKVQREAPDLWEQVEAGTMDITSAVKAIKTREQCPDSQEESKPATEPKVKPLTAKDTIGSLIAKAKAGEDLMPEGKILAHYDKHMVHHLSLDGVEIYVVMKKPKQPRK